MKNVKLSFILITSWIISFCIIGEVIGCSLAYWQSPNIIAKIIGIATILGFLGQGSVMIRTYQRKNVGKAILNTVGFGALCVINVGILKLAELGAANVSLMQYGMYAIITMTISMAVTLTGSNVNDGFFDEGVSENVSKFQRSRQPNRNANWDTGPEHSRMSKDDFIKNYSNTAK